MTVTSRHLRWLPAACAVVLAFALVACGDEADHTVSEGTGTEPVLPEPSESLIPTVNIAPPERWPEGTKPRTVTDLEVTAFADELEHPRWIYVLPNGDVLVAESNAQPASEKEEEQSGIKKWVMGLMKEGAGAGTPSADRITLLRDEDGDGTVDERSIFLDNLTSPFGMVVLNGDLYVANTDSLMRFPYDEGDMRISEPGEKVTDLPAGPPNRHWTKSLVADPDGTRLYVGVGSNSDHAENGMKAEQGRAAIWEVDPETGEHRIYASGLRNPVGMDWNPETGALWVSVNERDELGSDLVPDYMTSVKPGGFYGWPWSYYGEHVDTRVEPRRPEMVKQAIRPDYALGPHTASLGFTFADEGNLPSAFERGAFIGQHGSWNREPPSGYKVIFVPFQNGWPSGPPVDVLTGFLDGDGNARGRPVGVTFDQTGALLVADDVDNVIWRVSAADKQSAQKR